MLIKTEFIVYSESEIFKKLLTFFVRTQQQVVISAPLFEVRNEVLMAVTDLF